MTVLKERKDPDPDLLLILPDFYSRSPKVTDPKGSELCRKISEYLLSLSLGLRHLAVG
jgi:hypothetical protein